MTPNIQAIIFCKNDFKRLAFTLRHFTAFNPDIPVTVLNAAGNNPELTAYLSSFSNHALTVRNVPEVRHTKNASGLFNLVWFAQMFTHGLDCNHTHLLYLETDVLTNNLIHTSELTDRASFDMAGPTNTCAMEDAVLWEHAGLGHVKHKLHTGCGGTIYKREFFERSLPNYKFVEELWKKWPAHFYGDLAMTLLGLYSGCTVGWWKETSNVGGHMIIENDEVTYTPCDYGATLVHNFKV